MIQYSQMDYADIPEVISLGAQMHKESRYAKYPYDEDYCLDMAGQVIKDDMFYSGLAKENEELIGMIFGFLNKVPFCKAISAGDLLFYVHPEKRNGKVALHLVRDFEKWARYHNVEEIQMGISADINPDRVAKFYNRLGYDYHGHFMIKGKD